MEKDKLVRIVGDDPKQEKVDTPYKRESRNRLERTITTKIKTTMIGALDAIERNFGFLWEDNFELQEIYEKVRKEILDNGNDQIKSLAKELKGYDIELLRYNITLKGKFLGGGNDDGK